MRRTGSGAPGSDHGLERQGGRAIDGFVRLEVHERLASTSDRLHELARAGAPPFTAVIADRQTAGRGRGGRRWHSAAGAGLWISVLLPPPPGGPPGVASLAVGVAAARAIEQTCGIEVGLKWPNDLLVRCGAARPEPGKVGGVLCEASTGPGGSPFVAAGVGVNLRSPPEPEARAPELLAAAFLEEAAGRRVDAHELAAALARELHRFADPPPARLEGRLAEEWRARDLLRGRRVLSETTPPGTALGPGRDGLLRVSDEAGRIHLVRAGSVRVEGDGSAALFAGESRWRREG